MRDFLSSTVILFLIFNITGEIFEMRQYGYIRVSSKDQNIARQAEALLQLGIEQKNIFIDKQSGKDFNRSGFKRLVRRLKSEDELYIKSIDRLGRDYDEILEQWRYLTKTRDVTNNEHADNLYTETFKNVYNYTPTQEPVSQGFFKDMIATFVSIFDDSALDGTFDTETGTHTDDCDPEEPHAHVQEGTTFLKNGKEDMPVGEDAKIGLLWDNFLPDVLGSETRMEKLHNKSLDAVGEGTFDTNGTIHRDFKYIDLVDMTDGNVWVGTLSRDVTVYYPYPEGVDKNDDIAITY